MDYTLRQNAAVQKKRSARENGRFFLNIFKIKTAKYLTVFKMSGYPDSNGGPPAPEAGALSQLRHIPKLSPCGANSHPLRNAGANIEIICGTSYQTHSLTAPLPALQ